MPPSMITNPETTLAVEPGPRAETRRPYQLLKTGFHTIGSNVLCAVGSILTTWVVARLAGPATKGAYDLYIAAAAMVNIIVGFSLPSGLVYVSARKASNLVKLVPILLLVAAIEGAITCVTFFVLHRTWLASVFLPAGAGRILILGLSLTVALGALSTFLRALLVGSHRFIQANLGDLGKQVIGLVAASVALTVGVRGHHGVMALICANILTLALGAVIYLKAIPFREQMHSENSGLKEAMAYSAPCYGANLAQFMNYKLDVFFVNAMVGTAALGIYQLAVTLTQSLALLPTAAATILLPLVAAEHERPVENAARTAQVARLIVFVSAISGLILGVVSFWVIPKAFGPAFSASVVPLLVLLPGAICLSLASVLASHLAGIGRPDLNLRASLAGLFVTVPLDILLIPRAGIVGAALASSCAYFLSTALNAWYFHRKTNISIKELVLISPAEIWSVLDSCRKLTSTKKTMERISAC
jgi:O-antigen/teichoic acid export membrane protein